MRGKLEYLIKHNAFIQFIYRKVFSFLFKVLGLFTGFKKNQVLFSSMSGDLFGGSPKSVFDYMKHDERFNGFSYIWAFRDPISYNSENIKTVKINSFKYFVVALQSGVWVTDVNIERGLKFKKKRTIYLNTWHGTGPKKSGNSVVGRKDYDFSYVDILCCDGVYMRDILINSYNANENNMLWCGRPREDSLFTYNSEDKFAILKKLGISQNKKIVLYMPTWREGSFKPLNLSLWHTMLGDDYVLLYRAHHFTRDTIIDSSVDGFCIDVSDYKDVNDLYLVSDILVSDYSSAFFDFGLLRKPMICYAYDYDEFISEYGLYFDLKNDFPNSIFYDEKSVLSFILSMNYNEECKKCGDYCYSYVSHPVNATKTCVDRIFELYSGCSKAVS